MNKFIELCADFLNRDDWNFSRFETDAVNGLGYLMAKYSGDNCRMDVVFDANPEKDLMMVFVYMSVMVPESKRRDMAELVCRINHNLSIGGFELDMDDGDLRYMVAMDVEGGELVPTMVQNMRDSSISTCDRYYPALMSLIYGDKSPKDAIESVRNPAGRPADVSVQ
jgi:hypothetical protein